jgi:TonB family protein
VKLTFRKIFYWSLGGHVGFLLTMCIVSLVVSCSQKTKTVPHVFTLHAAPPAESTTVTAPPQQQAPPKKSQPRVVEKKTPPKKEPPKPKPTQSYAEFLKNNPIKAPQKEVPEQSPPPVSKPVEDPLADVRKELHAMLRDASQDTRNTNSFDLKALHGYVSQLRNQLNVLWEQPENLPPGEWLVHVEFTVSANGRISGIRFVKRSNNPAFDDSIIRAMNQFQSVSPPPDRKTHTFEIPFRMLVR